MATNSLFLKFTSIDLSVDGHKSLDAAVTEIKNHTWQYAKKQITWLKRYKEIDWVEIKNLQKKVQVFENNSY